MHKNKKTLVLIDAHAVLHRAFHALPNFTSPKGEPTGALYGFAAFLLKVIRELKPDYIAVCYDLPELTFRRIAYEKYKAKRPKMDDVLAEQINRSRDILSSFKIPIYDSPGFEADDILGTIVEQLRQDTKIIIASGDLDTLQLISDDDIVVYTLSKGIKEAVIYNEDKVKERYGFVPKLLPDFKGLRGDPSDNIIGVQGIGNKTAAELIQKFGGLKNLYGVLKKDKSELEKAGIKPRIIEKLEKNEEEAMFSKSLAEIRRDAPIKFSLKDAEWEKEFNIEKAKSLFNEFGFKSLVDRLPLSLIEKFKGKVPEKLFNEIELPLSGILNEMQKTGILLDIRCLTKLSKEYHKKLKELEKKIWSLAGEEFNINSPRQLGNILFGKLGLKPRKPRKTGTGAFSTNISELLKFKEEHTIISEIISYREFAKLISTYIDALPKMTGKDNRLHTTFDQSGTATGRISSRDPNLQNIPKRTELGRNIRRAFIADKGFNLVAFDYSQIELRVAAILSKDEKMKEIFKKDADVHNSVASEVFSVAPDKVTSEMRRRAKIINFGIIYGMGVNALSKSLGCSKEEAQLFRDEYFKDFKGMADFLDKTREEVYKKGFTETLFGRKRYFPEFSPQIDWAIERMAINAPIQGTAADFIKIAMVKTNEILKEKGLKSKARLLLQIHDELLYEIEEGAINEIVPLIAKTMEEVYQCDIPIKVNVAIGKNWADMVEYKYGK